jgi:O-antigen ligase
METVLNSFNAFNAYSSEVLERAIAAVQRLLATPERRARALYIGLVLFGLAWGTLVAVGGVGAALLAVSLVACIACALDFRAGVMLLIIIMPISASAIFPHAMFGMTGANPLNLLLVMTLAMCMMNSGLGMKGFIPRPLYWLYLVPFFVFSVIGSFHVGEIHPGFKANDMIYFDGPGGYIRDEFLKPVGLVLYALLVSAAVGRSRQPEKFVTPMFISIFVMAMLAIIFVIESGASLSQLAGTYSRAFFSHLGMHANDLGRLYATAYALLLFVWDRTERIALKTALLFAMACVAIALVLTFSRGAFLGFIIVNLIYLGSRRTLKTLLLALLVIPPAIMLAPGALWSRLGMGVGQGMDDVSAGRTDEIWAPLLPEVFKTPPWGNGIGSIMWSRPMRMEEMMFVGHPHNAYLAAYLDGGAIGLVLLLGFWIYAWFSFRRYAKDERIVPELQGFFEGAAAGVVSFLIAGFAGSSLLPVPEQGFLWLALGILWGVKRHLHKPAPKPAPIVAPKPDFHPVPRGAGPHFDPRSAKGSA